MKSKPIQTFSPFPEFLRSKMRPSPDFARVPFRVKFRVVGRIYVSMQVRHQYFSETKDTVRCFHRILLPFLFEELPNQPHSSNLRRVRRRPAQVPPLRNPVGRALSYGHSHFLYLNFQRSLSQHPDYPIFLHFQSHLDANTRSNACRKGKHNGPSSRSKSARIYP